jgi:hypothetical protein
MNVFSAQSSMRNIHLIPGVIIDKTITITAAIPKFLRATVYKEFFFHDVNCRIIKNTIIRNYG